MMSLYAITCRETMSRWEPDAAGRFRAAAMELFVERGYEQTSVADIATRAGLTARTFFRHFDDKREVLFDGSRRLQEIMVGALAAAPSSATPIDAVGAAVLATAGFFSDNRDFGRKRHAVILANAELRERELIKMATLTAALAEALRARGVTEPDASLAAEAGIAVFRVAFGLWVAESEQRSRLRARTATG
jgi:AcrR family transcriptional regulator